MRMPFEIPAGLIADETALAAGPAWWDADKARFWRGKPQTIGGWERFNASTVTGICRNIFPWDDTAGNLNVAFGSHSNLQLAYGGSFYSLTPTLALPPRVASNPLSTTSGSAVVIVNHPGHGMATGDNVTVSGASAIGGITPNGTFAVTVTSIAAYHYTFSSNATGTVAAGGGGAVTLAPQTAFAAGNIDGVAGSGYGTGSYSGGLWSAASGASTYPRTWAFSKYGQNLIANPRGGTIYQWFNDTGTVAAPITNAPSQVMYALVTPQRQLLAFGCNEEVSGAFNPLCIRGSDIEDVNTWTTSSANNAFEHILEGGGHIVAARQVGAYLFVWTDTALHLGTFIGDPSQTYRFDQIGEHCGLIGPNAAVIGGETAAFWVSPDLNFYKCALGGTPQLVPSPLQSDLINYLAASQQEKIVLNTVSAFGEIWLHYPDSRDGTENSRYISVGTTSNASPATAYATLVEGAWSRGIMARTAFVDAGPFQYPIAVDPSGVSYLHERGHSADGGAFSWYIESAAQAIGNGEQMMMIRGVWPDFKDQIGPVSLTIYTRKYPQDSDRVKGPYSIAPNQTKRDFLATGRMVRVRISGSANPTYARLGKPSFDIQPTGLQ